MCVEIKVCERSSFGTLKRFSHLLIKDECETESGGWIIGHICPWASLVGQWLSIIEREVWSELYGVCRLISGSVEAGSNSKNILSLSLSSWSKSVIFVDKIYQTAIFFPCIGIWNTDMHQYTSNTCLTFLLECILVMQLLIIKNCLALIACEW